MYIHIGAGRGARRNTIVGIFDLDGSVTTADTAAFLKKADRDGRVTAAGEDLPKSFVIVSDHDPHGKVNPEYEVIFSHISSGKLAERGEMLVL